jgi:hypothetical protein
LSERCKRKGNWDLKGKINRPKYESLKNKTETSKGKNRKAMKIMTKNQIRKKKKLMK